MKLREDVSFRLPSFSVRLSDIRQNPALTVNQVFVPARIPPDSHSGSTGRTTGSGKYPPRRPVPSQA